MFGKSMISGFDREGNIVGNGLLEFSCFRTMYKKCQLNSVVLVKG